MTAIKDIEGIGEANAAQLAAAGVSTVEALLKEGGAAAGRRALAGKTGIDESRLLDWINRADLMRIKGIGSEFSDLLEAAGVDTVRELAQRNAPNLHAKLTEVNETKKLVRSVPALSEVEDFIRQAEALGVAVSH